MSEFSIKTANLTDLKTLLTFKQGVVETERPLDSFLSFGELHYHNTLELFPKENIHFTVVISNKKLVYSNYSKTENYSCYYEKIKHRLEEK